MIGIDLVIHQQIDEMSPTTAHQAMKRSERIGVNSAAANVAMKRRKIHHSGAALAAIQRLSDWPLTVD